MRSEKKKRGGGKVVLVIILIVVFVAATLGTVFVVMGGMDGLFAPKADPAEVPAGDVMAMRLSPPTATDKEGMQAYFADAVDYAVAAGLNTIVFEAKKDLTVWWRDKIFPAPEAIAGQDAFLSKLDPLALLCDAVKGSGLQLWLEVDAYASGGYNQDAKGKAVALADGLADGTRFAYSDAEYNKLLVESLSRLPRSYSIAGIVLGGFSGSEAVFDTETEAFKGMLEALQDSLADEGRLIPVGLAFPEESGFMTSALAVQLTVNGLVRYLLPEIAPGGALSSRMGAYAAGSGFIAVQPADEATGLYLFTASRSSAYGGALLGSYSEMKNDAARLGMLRSALTQVDAPLPTGFDIPRVLGITFPAEGKTLTWEGVYITGHSNPDQPLLLDGVEVAGRASNGAFGVFVSLQMGDNTFTFQNGDVTAVKTITRVEPSSGGGGGGKPTADGTKEAEPGQAVKVNRIYANALSTYNDLSSLNELFHQDAVFVVRDSRQLTYGNSLTWAYQLASGDWVWAMNCEWVEGDGTAAFTALAAEPHEKGEYLNFVGSGTPAAYISYGNEDGSLKITMYDTTFTLPEGFSSQLVSSASVSLADGGGVVLTLQTNNLWGYHIEYVDGQTRLFLKARPAVSMDPAKPLAGVHVMLDPGHGGPSATGMNYGSPGIAGDNGYPHEKDINLALSQAIGYRLQQLGATVTYTRTEDVNLGINERYLMQIEQKPDFFISVHHDGIDQYQDLSELDKIFGIYYHPYNMPPSKLFAQNLMDYVSAETGREKEENPRWGGINYGVIRTTLCASVLFEYGLIGHPEHYDQATSTDGIWATAFGTAQAIVATVQGA